MLPRHRRHALNESDGVQVSRRHLLFVHFGQQGRVVVADRIGNQPGAIVPDLLLGFRLNLELAAIDERDRPAEPVIGLAPVERLLYALTQLDIVNEVQYVDGAKDVVQLPQGLFGVVLPGVAA